MSTDSTEIALNGVNALDLIPSLPVKGETIAQFWAWASQNFGVTYSDIKMKLFAEAIRNDGWSEERFLRTFSWFRKNKFNPAWTEFDWFNYQIKVYPNAWYKKQVNDLGDKANDMIESYKLPNGNIVYKFVDENILPFESLGTIRAQINSESNKMIAILCECGNVVWIRKRELIENKKTLFICKNGAKQCVGKYTYEEILDKEKNGEANFIQLVNEEHL